MAETRNINPLLIDLQCFPGIYYYSTLLGYPVLVFEQYEHLQKGSYANRYYVAGSGGELLLTVPLLRSGGNRKPFRDWKICDRDPWQKLHWRTLLSAYRRSPWFLFYEDSLRPMYEKKFEYLIDWNLEAFHLVNGWLGLAWEISFTGEYKKAYPERADARNRIMPGKVPADKSVSYHQVFEERTGFLPGLSILDLVFCEGKRAAWLLRGGSKG